MQLICKKRMWVCLYFGVSIYRTSQSWRGFSVLQGSTIAEGLVSSVSILEDGGTFKMWGLEEAPDIIWRCPLRTQISGDSGSAWERWLPEEQPGSTQLSAPFKTKARSPLKNSCHCHLHNKWFRQTAALIIGPVLCSLESALSKCELNQPLFQRISRNITLTNFCSNFANHVDIQYK